MDTDDWAFGCAATEVTTNMRYWYVVLCISIQLLFYTNDHRLVPKPLL